MKTAGVFSLSLLLGCIASFGMAPHHLWPLTVFALIVLFWFYRNNNSNRLSAFVVFAFCYGYFGFGLRWIAQALTFFPSLPSFLSDLSIFGIPFVLSLPYFVCAFFIKRYTSSRHSTWLLALSWVIIDFIRGYLVLPFPWSFMGSIFGDSLVILQITSVIGIFGLTMALLVSVHFFLQGKKSILIVLFFWSLSFIWGYQSLHQNQTVNDLQPTIALIQPTWTQQEKTMGFYNVNYENRLLSLTKQAINKNNAKIIIWPETAIFERQWYNNSFQQNLRKILSGGHFLIVGVLAKKNVNDHFFGSNEVWVVDDNLNILSKYSKRKLVPFGEYVPLISHLPLVFSNQIDAFSFIPGDDNIKPLQLPKLPSLSPQICYESLFSGINVATGARWIVNITNDAWFGSSWGPYQHFYQARVRAIEEGIPMARVANTGITAIIDDNGRIISQLPRDTADILVGKLPMATKSTIFSYLGLWSSFIFSLLLSFICYLTAKR